MPYFCAPNLELDLSFLPPQAFTGQHILLSSLLQMLAFNRSNIWEAAAEFELWILGKKLLLLLHLRIPRTTFSLLREGLGPEGTETLEHKDCHRTCQFAQLCQFPYCKDFEGTLAELSPLCKEIRP